MRLTKEQILNATANKYFVIGGRIYGKKMFSKMTAELLEYKDIEDELGIDLITLFKAIYEGIYVKTKNGISKHYTVSLRKWFQTNTYCLYYRPYTHIWFKDYGKTWALTKEELKQ